MAPLSAADQRYPWLRYQVEGYTEGIIHSYEQRLETIWSRLVNWVYVLDFEGLTPGMRQDFAVRLRMVYNGEFILEFLRTCRMSDTEMGLDVANTLCFQLEAQYLFRHANGRKSGARLSGGHFIGRLAMHFGLVSDEGLRGLQGPERQQAAAADAHEADKAGPAAKE
ncbi:hypothetical protein Tco_0853119 [Tanacetum coccineum]